MEIHCWLCCSVITAIRGMDKCPHCGTPFATEVVERLKNWTPPPMPKWELPAQSIWQL